jgi:hypothetical protein
MIDLFQLYAETILAAAEPKEKGGNLVIVAALSFG